MDQDTIIMEESHILEIIIKDGDHPSLEIVVEGDSER